MAVGVPISSLPPKSSPSGTDYFPIVDATAPISVKRVTFDSLKAFCLNDPSLVKIASPTEQAKTGFVKRTSATGNHSIIAEGDMPFNQLTKISLTGTVTGSTPVTSTSTDISILTANLNILGKPVNGTLASNTFLKYDGSNWTPSAISVGSVDASSFVSAPTDITSSNVLFTLPIGSSNIVVWAAIQTTTSVNQVITFNGTSTPVFKKIYYAHVCLDSTGASVNNDIKMSSGYASLSITAASGTKIRVLVIGDKI